MASRYSAWLDIESDSRLSSPAHAARRTTVDKTPSALELDSLTFGTRYTGPAADIAASDTPREMPLSIESNPPAGAVAATQSLRNPAKNFQRFIAACFMFMLFGLNDAAPGALLPYLEKYYDIDYTIVSLVFVANALGFVLAAFITNRMHAWLGRAKVMGIGLLCSVVSYVLLVCTPPYALVVVSFLLTGLGNALCIGLTNGFIAGLVNGTVLLGLCHASYGIGGTLGPLIATALVGSGHRWSVFYTLTLALSVIDCAAIVLAYRGMEDEDAALSSDQSRLHAAAAAAAAAAATAEPSQRSPPAPTPQPPNQRSKPRASLGQAFRSRVVLLGAAFIFAYQAAEVTISGWVLSFVLASRPHPPSQSVSLGYISSGFWAGITLGRIVLTPPAQRIGERTAVIGLLALTVVFQFVIWFVPNIIADAVAVAIVGMLTGPIYPCATVIFSRMMTRDELVPALSIITALGSSGGAAGPFITGVLGQTTGPWVLNPIVVGLIVMMYACWFSLPKLSRHAE